MDPACTNLVQILEHVILIQVLTNFEEHPEVGEACSVRSGKLVERIEESPIESSAADCSNSEGEAQSGGC